MRPERRCIFCAGKKEYLKISGLQPADLIFENAKICILFQDYSDK